MQQNNKQKAKATLTKKTLEANVHYYIENGMMVFTETYHKLRGYCCGSGCRHCPYNFKKN